MTSPDNTKRYWTERMRRGDITAIGRIGASTNLNSAIYSLTIDNVLRLVRERRLVPAPRALDVGTGWGVWLDVWHKQQIPVVDATDFTDASIEHVRRLWPTGGTYWEADVSDPTAFQAIEGYPLVSCMNVLLHVLDQERFEQSLRNLAGVVLPGGHLLLAEPLVTRGPVRRKPVSGAASLARDLDEIRRPLADQGLDLLCVAPSAAITGDPVEAPHRAAMLVLIAWWKLVIALDRIAFVRPALATGVRRADRWAQRRGWAQTGKILLFRKRDHLVGQPNSMKSESEAAHTW